jgi:hypothetical protein
MILTKHGIKRIKKRLGLPKRAHFRHINRVFQEGKIFMDRGYEGLKIFYHGFLYIFSFTERQEPVFVTTFRESDFLVG